MAFAAVVWFMGVGLVDPILPAIAKNLHTSPSQVELLFTSYFAFTGSSTLVSGVVASRIGARRTLLAGPEGFRGGTPSGIPWREPCKPHLVYITADATFIVGGATGQSRATSIRAMGQVDWVSYGTKSAKGTGTLWELHPGPHGFWAAHKATLTASQVHSSQFTALSMIYARQRRMWTQTYHLVKQLGELSWLPHGVPKYET